MRVSQSVESLEDMATGTLVETIPAKDDPAALPSVQTPVIDVIKLREQHVQPWQIKVIQERCNGNFEEKDENGFTPLMIACHFHCDAKVYQFLLQEQRVSWSSTNHWGEKALHHAASYGSNQALRILLQHDTEIDAKDEDGMTALMDAACGLGDFQSVQLLLQKGADPALRDLEGRTAYDFAKAEDKDQPMLNLLQINLPVITTLLATKTHERIGQDSILSRLPAELVKRVIFTAGFKL